MLGIEYDSTLSDTSTNAVQNKVIAEELDKKADIIADTNTGNPVVFDSAISDMPLKSIQIEWEPEQTGENNAT